MPEGVSYDAPQLLAQGYGALAQGINQFGTDLFGEYEKKRKEREQQQAELRANDIIISHHLAKMTPQQREAWSLSDEGQKYQTGSLKDKWAVSHGIVTAMANDLQDQQQQAQTDYLKAHKAYLDQQAAYIKSLQDDPFVRDNAGNPVGMKTKTGMKGLPSEMTPETMQKEINAQAKARGLDDDVFGNQVLPDPTGKSAPVKMQPYQRADGQIFVWKGGTGNQASDPNDPKQYSTFHPKVWGVLAGRYNKAYGVQTDQELMGGTPLQVKQPDAKTSGASAPAAPATKLAPAKEGDTRILDVPGRGKVRVVWAKNPQTGKFGWKVVTNAGGAGPVSVQ